MSIINSISDILWTYIIIVLLVGCAIYFTIRTKGVQFRTLKDMIRIMLGKDQPKDELGMNGKKKIGSFQAFAISLGSRVGTGNLAGVASAIFIGGPGAVFWMWLMALLGGSTAFVEATLAQLYKKKGKDSFYGGPAYYMETGLKSKWMGVLFSVLMVATFALANSMLQSNTIADSLNTTFGWSKTAIAIAVTLATLAIVVGGVRRISNIVSYMVPVMALGYMTLSLVIIVMNIGQIPDVFALIFKSAFGFRQFGGGMVGAAILQGVKRGLFSNEAGEGSAPNAAAVAETSHPIKQGLVQALGVFIDTIVICSCTAFIVLLSGKYTGSEDGIILTISSMESLIGPIGKYFVTVAVFLFAFSTIIGNYFYGENNIRFITDKKWAIYALRIMTAGILLWGAFESLPNVWVFVDISMGLLTLCNLVAIALLSKYVFRLLDDYTKQKKEGKEPQFRKNTLPDIESDLEGWE